MTFDQAGIRALANHLRQSAMSVAHCEAHPIPDDDLTSWTAMQWDGFAKEYLTVYQTGCMIAAQRRAQQKAEAA